MNTIAMDTIYTSIDSIHYRTQLESDLNILEEYSKTKI